MKNSEEIPEGQNKRTVKNGIRLVMTGVLTIVYGIWYNVNHAVKHYPWAVISIMTTLYIIVSVMLFVNCRTLQVTAEMQRDSIGMELERITSTSYFRYTK